MSDRPTITVAPTANRRYVEIEVNDTATTTTILVTRKEASELIENLTAVRAGRQVEDRPHEAALRFTVTVEPEVGGGFVAGISADGENDSGVTAGIYGDTAAEAAMTAIYDAYEGDEGRNGWHHGGST